MLNGLFRVAYVAPMAGDVLDPDTGRMRAVTGRSVLLSSEGGHQANFTIIDSEGEKRAEIKVGQELSVSIEPS